MNEPYYYENQKYSNFLDSQKKEDFKKVSDFILKYTKADSKILDVGCGSGNLLESIDNRVNKYGVDISKTSINKSLNKKLKCKVYDGKSIPFKENEFDLVNTFNVLEHVDNVETFLSENLRVLKKGGYFVLVCPNFLSTTNNYHWHTSSTTNKIKNFFNIIRKILYQKYYFEKIQTIDREDFHPDDDACNVTNPIDIINWSKKYNLSIIYYSSQSVYKSSNIINIIDKTILKVFFGACFFVFQKN